MEITFPCQKITHTISIEDLCDFFALHITQKGIFLQATSNRMSRVLDCNIEHENGQLFLLDESNVRRIADLFCFTIHIPPVDPKEYTKGKKKDQEVVIDGDVKDTNIIIGNNNSVAKYKWKDLTLSIIISGDGIIVSNK